MIVNFILEPESLNETAQQLFLSDLILYMPGDDSGLSYFGTNMDLVPIYDPATLITGQNKFINGKDSHRTMTSDYQIVSYNH